MPLFDDLKRAVRQAAAPANVGLVIALFLSYVVMWLAKSVVLFKLLAFIPSTHQVWTVLTYPFASTGAGDAFICMLILVWWLWSIGNTVEKEMGTHRYLLFFFVCTALGAISMVVASVVLKSSAPLYGALIPVASITVAWGMANPNSQILMMMIVPMAGRWVALIAAGIVLFALGDGNPVVGVFGLLPLLFATAVATNRIPFYLYSQSLSSRKNQNSIENKRARAIEDKVRNRKKEREERDRLRKLFESSIDDEK